MQATEYALTLLSSAAVSASLVAAILWLTKAWIGERLRSAIKGEYDTKLESHKAQLKAEYDHLLETHKIQLKAQADLELEQLKSLLSVSAAEQNATFSRLHERRVDVIAKTYGLLRRLHTSIAEYTTPFEMGGGMPRQERRTEAAKASSEFSQYFSHHSKILYFLKFSILPYLILSYHLTSISFIHSSNSIKINDTVFPESE